MSGLTFYGKNDPYKGDVINVAPQPRIDTSLPQSAPSDIANSKYNAFGSTLEFQSGKIIIIYREGVDHAATPGVLKQRVSSNRGKSFSSSITIFSDTKDLRNTAGWVDRRNIGHLFWSSYNNAGLATISYAVSSDEGETWSSPVTMDTGDALMAQPYSIGIDFGNGVMIQGWCDNGSTSSGFNQYIFKSTDYGITWTSIVVSNKTSIYAPNEGTFMDMEGGWILALMRMDRISDGEFTGYVNPGFLQCVSSDYGSTWTEIGITTFDMYPAWDAGRGSATPPAIRSYRDAQDGKLNAGLFYYSRGKQKLMFISGDPDILKTSVTGWKGTVKTIQSDVFIPNFAGGYPSMINPNQGTNFFGWYYHELNANVCDIRFFTFTAPSGIRVYHPVTINKITNSRFGICSGSTLENIGNNLLVSWANGSPGYDTFTSSSSPNIASAIYTGSGTESAASAAITLTKYKIYKIVITLTLNSGQAPSLAMTNLNHTTTALVNGANTLVREASNISTILTLSNTAASNWSAICTFYEVQNGYVGADTLAPDGWNKSSGMSIWREPLLDNISGVLYRLKVTGTSGAKYLTWDDGGKHIRTPFIQKFANKEITFGADIIASDVGVISLYAYDGTTEYHSNYHTGSGSVETLRLTLTVPTTTTDFKIGFHINGAYTAYIMKPMLKFGDQYDSRDWEPMTSEIIYLATAQNDNILIGKTFSTTSDTDYKIVPSFSGVVGKGTKAILVRIQAKDSASVNNSTAFWLEQTNTAGRSCNCNISGTGNGQWANGVGWVSLDTDDGCKYGATASGTNTLTVDFVKILAVQY